MKAVFRTPIGKEIFFDVPVNEKRPDGMLGPPIQTIYEIGDGTILPIRHLLLLTIVSEGVAYYTLVK